MKKMWLMIIAVLVVAPGTQARDFTVSICGTGQVAADKDFDPLSANDTIGMAHIEVGMELDEILEGLSLELAYQGGSVESDLFAGQNPWLHTQLLTHGIVVSTSMRIPLADWLNTMVRLGATIDFARLRLSSDADLLLSDWSLARLGAVASAGIEVLLPRNQWRDWFDKPRGDAQEGFTMGIRLEAGWSFRQAYEFDQMIPAEGGAGKIALQDVGLGGVGLDGFMFRAGLVVFF